MLMKKGSKVLIVFSRLASMKSSFNIAGFVWDFEEVKNDSNKIAENDEDAEYIAFENDALAVSQKKKLLFDDAS